MFQLGLNGNFPVLQGLTILLSTSQGPAFQTLNWTFESVFKLEQVFRNFRNSILMSFFCNFWKVRNRTNSKFSIISELSQTFSKLFPNFLTQKQGFRPKNRKLFPDLLLILQKFCEFEKTRYFCKMSELRKPNYSKTLENEKLRKFRLMQGLKCYF